LTGDAAALAFRRRVQVLDQIARGGISVSGAAIIAAVLGIGLFLCLEIAPLFGGAQVRSGPMAPLPPALQARALLVDEYQEAAVVIGDDPVAHVLALGRTASPAAVPLDGLMPARITAAARALEAPTLALGTAAGEVWVGRVEFETTFPEGLRTVRPAVTAEAVVPAAPGYAVTAVAFRQHADQEVYAAIVDERHAVLTQVRVQRPLIGPARRILESVPLPLEGVGRPTRIVVSGDGAQVLVGTAEGRLGRWRLAVGAEGAELVEVVTAVPGGGVSALTYLLGDRSLAVGGSDGSVATWFPVRDEAQPDGWRLARVHEFPAHLSPVTAIQPSRRDKGFITLSADGTARLHYMTSERTLATMRLPGRPLAADFAPKADGLFVADEHARLHRWRIHNPHPEISWRALFGKVWYEGYPAPDYVWQSTGGTDDFESKFSLVPLAFGTLKGTFYALLFAVPLAVLGALYCSQFLDKRLRTPVKSTVELMAALPSVVLGFVAGLVMAPLVERQVVGVLVMPVVAAVVALLGHFVTAYGSPSAVRLAARRHEFLSLMGWTALGGACAIAWGPGLEQALFAGDFQAWLLNATGTRYDQRNALVVGWAMGFAVIPVIFTICEDAFSAVPRHLVGASLACGASAWQTAWRVVLPAAGSGVFSAVMVGFGRAVGETMIVLMATGNTPVLDWTAFNGFRALSANIAVEIPEAPHGGTLYRVLFIAALLLFAMTFVVNTVAELIRLRLRRQLQGL
jgi:phosphate transport system permease protein